MALKGEDSIQAAIADWLDLNPLGLDYLWFHVPNGGHMSPAMGRKRKRLGMKAGCPDIFVFFRDGTPIQMEVKATKGKLSRSQKDWQERCERLDLRYYVVRSVDDVVEIMAGTADRLILEKMTTYED